MAAAEILRRLDRRILHLDMVRVPYARTCHLKPRAVLRIDIRAIPQRILPFERARPQFDVMGMLQRRFAIVENRIDVPAVMREELRALAGEERLAGFGHVLLRSGCKCIWSVIHRMLLHALLEENRNFKYLKSNREPRSSGANTAPCGKSGNARRNRQRNQPISAAGYFATAASICSSVDVATPWMRNGFRYVACV